MCTKDNKKQLGILQFNLEDSDAKKEMELCLKVKDFMIALWDVDQKCREALKYKDFGIEAEKLLEEIRELCAPYIDLVE